MGLLIAIAARPDLVGPGSGHSVSWISVLLDAGLTLFAVMVVVLAPRVLEAWWAWRVRRTVRRERS